MCVCVYVCVCVCDSPPLTTLKWTRCCLCCLVLSTVFFCSLPGLLTRQPFSTTTTRVCVKQRNERRDCEKKRLVFVFFFGFFFSSIRIDEIPIPNDKQNIANKFFLRRASGKASREVFKFILTVIRDFLAVCVCVCVCVMMMVTGDKLHTVCTLMRSFERGRGMGTTTKKEDRREVLSEVRK